MNDIEGEGCNVDPEASTSKRERRRNYLSFSQENDGEFSLRDSDFDLILSGNTDDDFGAQTEKEKMSGMSLDTLVTTENLQ